MLAAGESIPRQLKNIVKENCQSAVLRNGLGPLREMENIPVSMEKLLVGDRAQ